MKESKLPSKYNYGNYSNENYGAHSIAIEIPPSRKNHYGIKLYFSYDTIIAFRGFVNGSMKTYARVNEWGCTTGKHLNCIGVDKKERLNEKEFERLYKQALKNA